MLLLDVQMVSLLLSSSLCYISLFFSSDMERDVQEKLQLQLTTVCAALAWPIMLELEVSKKNTMLL